MPTIEIEIKDKIAKSPLQRIVCGNSDYEIVFAFDEEWAAHEVKTARFAYSGTHEDVVFSGNVCSVPIIHNATACLVGVFAGDLLTTTPATVYCYKSILCAGGVPADPRPDVYQQLMEQIDAGMLQGQRGEQGPQGEKGEPGTTDYTKLDNKPVIPPSITEVEHQYAVSNSEDSVSNVETWTKITSSFSQRERSCIYANGYYVVCGVGGEVGYSKDGVNWTKVDKFVSGTLTNITYGKGKFIIVDEFDGLWMAEETPEVWTRINDGADFVGGIGSITYANNQFVIAGGNLAAFSEDCISWTIVEAPGSYNQITFGNGRYVAVGANGAVGVSYDGKNWADRSNPDVTGDLRAVTYVKGRYIIGGIDGLIMYTEDFVTWGIATSNSAGVRYVRQITYAENKCYAACYTSSGKGEIWTSLDGITWTVQQQMNYRLWCLNYNDGKLTTAGDSGAIFILDLCIVWQKKQAELADGQHLWERIVLTLSDGSKVIGDSVCIK